MKHQKDSSEQQKTTKIFRGFGSAYYVLNANYW